MDDVEMPEEVCFDRGDWGDWFVPDIEDTGTRYVHASKHDALAAENARLRERVQQLDEVAIQAARAAVYLEEHGPSSLSRPLSDALFALAEVEQ